MTPNGVDFSFLSCTPVLYMPDRAFHHMFAYSLPPPAVLVLPLPNCALELTSTQKL